MPVDSQITLFERLRESGLLDSAQLEALAKLPEARDTDPRALGRVLLHKGFLTRYQITLLAKGRAHELHIGPYLLLDKLGEGGMGQVFKGRHQHMSRLVALKMIRPERLSAPESVQRFYQEVQAAAQLHHPNIVLAYDAGPAGKAHYFAMEYVEGTDLAKLVAEKGPLPPDVACEYIRQAALGLQHAHQKGMIHRDVKPANLLVTHAVTGQPQVKVLDMGLARLRGGSDPSLTQAGQVLGTPAFVAPEQAFDSRAADIRSDIYSLGCTLYFLLTGHPPFVAETALQTLLMHQSEPPVLKLRRGELPAGLKAVVFKMMAKQPGDRYRTPAAVAAALAPFARGEEAPKPPAVSAITETVLPKARKEAKDKAPPAREDDRLTARTAPRRARETAPVEEEAPPAPREKKREPIKKADNTLGFLLLGAGLMVPLLLALAGGVVYLALFMNKPAVKPGQPGNGSGGGVAGAPKPVPEEPIYRMIAEAVQTGKTTKTNLAGGGQQSFEDVPPEGALVVGLEVSLGKVVNVEMIQGKWGGQEEKHGRDEKRGREERHGREFTMPKFNMREAIQGIRPIYQSARGRGPGSAQGKISGSVTLEARPGYALSGITVRAGQGIEALSATFMAIEGQALDPAKTYTSEWVGQQGGGPTTTLGNDGAPVIGIFGSRNSKGPPVGGLGLVQAGAKVNKPAPGAPARP